MPPAPTDRFALLQWRPLLASGAFSVALGVALSLPVAARCVVQAKARFLTECSSHEVVGGGIGLGLLLWAMWVAAAVTHPWLPRARLWRRRALGVQVVLMAVVFAMFNRVTNVIGVQDGHVTPYTLQVLVTFAACVCLGLEYHQRGRRQQADADTLHQRSQAQARQLDAARAALLQAQVEPHFLFNTLAHLRRLAHTDAGAARAMLADLRRYLAAALPELRQAETPLARELDLVAAFLALHQRRIGPQRLALHYEVAPGLEHVIVPSTCLLTLAENAIKHGIGPQVDGGEIVVRAGPDPDDPGLLRLEVADTGAGMGSSSGSGTGLATLRARLASAYGGTARLSLHLNQPHGLIARVQLPWQ